MNSLRPLLDSPVFDLLAQSGTVTGPQAAAAAGVGLLVMLLAVGFGLVFYVFFCFCMKRICEKAGHAPGGLIWIPLVNFVPQLKAAQLPVWMIILFFIPVVNIGMYFFFWCKLCIARGKPGWMGVFALFPPFLMIYLAFAD